jgi:DNA repair protein RadC
MKTKKADAYSIMIQQCAAYVAEVKPECHNPEDVVNVMRPLVDGQEQESFWVILVNTKNRMKQAPVRVTLGLLDSSMVHPREVFRVAVQNAASGIILAHNHPSGDPTPSAEDCSITKRFVEAGSILGIRVIDHVIIGQKTATTPGYCSLREKGLVTF